ncbi:MAG: NTP transferase domain-containing protein, partial [Actinomycetota bacterium]
MSERMAARERSLAVVVLAAGESKRFKSRTPKVLHDLCGIPLIGHVLEALHPLGATKTVLVVGKERDEIAAALKRLKVKAVLAVQDDRLGTADAARVGDEALGAFRGDVLVTPGDTPLLDPETLRTLVEHHRAASAAATVLSAHYPDPAGYGRIVRDPDGGVARIVEHADATVAERVIAEGNAGVYVFDRAALRAALTRVEASNRQGEMYLTDVIEILRDKGERIEVYVAPDAGETIGINDRAQLADAAVWVRRRINERLMREGVTIEDPATTYVDATVTVGRDTTIRPLTFL